MPRVDPVMTATFPFMSNKVMCFSQIDLQSMSFQGASKRRTWNLEIPGLVLRTIPE